MHLLLVALQVGRCTELLVTDRAGMLSHAQVDRLHVLLNVPPVERLVRTYLSLVFGPLLVNRPHVASQCARIKCAEVTLATLHTLCLSMLPVGVTLQAGRFHVLSADMAANCSTRAIDNMGSVNMGL